MNTAFTVRTKKEVTSHLGDKVATGIMDEQITHVGTSGCPWPPHKTHAQGVSSLEMTSPLHEVWICESVSTYPAARVDLGRKSLAHRKNLLNQFWNDFLPSE
jgi:hypothetical protein